MKALVTGGTGFIGSALVRHLLASRYDVRVLSHGKRNRFLLEGLDVEVVSGDVQRFESVEKAVKGCSVVFDLASLYSFYPFWRTQPRSIYRINVQGTIHLINASLKYGVQKFIHTSSIATIGKRTDGHASDETTAFEEAGASHYARSKYLAEQEVLKFCKKGLPGVVLNPAIVLGMRDHKPTPSGDVIVKFLNQMLPGYFETLWSIADVDDVARAHVAAIERGRVGERYILCHEHHYTLHELFQILEKVSGVKAPRIKIPYPVLTAYAYLDEVVSHLILRKRPLFPSEGVRFCKMSVRYDNSKAVRELGYTQTPIEHTLHKAADWYGKNGFIEAPGFFRLKVGGTKSVAAVMRILGMTRYTDKLDLGTLAFYSIVRTLQFLKKIGIGPRIDGWRKVTECYLRTEESKFGLAAFALDYRSDVGDKEITSVEFAKIHLIHRLQQFIKSQTAFHYEIQWKPLSASSRVKNSTDVVLAEFEDDGSLKSLVPYFDTVDRAVLEAGKEKILLQAVIESYNRSRKVEDRKRPLVLKKEVLQWFSEDTSGRRMSVLDRLGRERIDRILSATWISFENSSSIRHRFQAPAFNLFFQPGFGLLNVRACFNEDLYSVDLWFQFNHIPIDGVPAQEILNQLKKTWGTRAKNLKLPSPDWTGGRVPQLASTPDRNPQVYHICQTIHFRSFLKLRRELNRRFAKDTKQTITTAALFIWKLAGYHAFRDVKFGIAVDLPRTRTRERTLGFIFIRPSIYFDKNKSDRGFFKFQKEFNRQILASRKRQSESFRLVDSYGLCPPICFELNKKVLARAMREFVGSVGVTIIKKSDYFVAPFSDIHTEGFIALSDYALPCENGDKVGVVSIKGPQEKIGDYMHVINDVMHRAVQNDEFYF